MKLLFAGIPKSDRAPLEKIVRDLGFEPESCGKPERLWKLLESSCRTSIVILSATNPDWCSRDILTRLKSLGVDQALYVIGACKGKKLKQPLALEDAVNDLIDIENTQSVQKKLEKGKSAIDTKQALLDANEVLERYSQHIDQIAEERARQLIHAERLSTLGVMSAGIAHEINTPIGFMSTSLESSKLYWNELEALIKSQIPAQSLTEQQLKMLERMPKALERIERGLEKVQNVTTGLKNFGRASQSNRRPVEINDCIREAVEVAEHAVQKVAEVRMHLSEPSPIVNANAQQLEQVMVNLLVNAAHALEGRTGERLIEISSSREAEWVSVVIEDNGPGIPEEIMDNIWQSFFTTKEEGKGTGLGLAISRGIVRDHSGSINVSNKAKGGAQFEVRLPIHSDKVK